MSNTKALDFIMDCRKSWRLVLKPTLAYLKKWNFKN